MKRYSEAEAVRAGKQFVLAAGVAVLALGAAGVTVGWAGLLAIFGVINRTPVPEAVMAFSTVAATAEVLTGLALAAALALAPRHTRVALGAWVAALVVAAASCGAMLVAWS